MSLFRTCSINIYSDVTEIVLQISWLLPSRARLWCAWLTMPLRQLLWRLWWTPCSSYLLCFKIKVMFGHKPCYKIKVTFGDFFLKHRQMNRNVARNNVFVVVDELPTQITIYTCLPIDIWTRRHRCTSMRFYALRCQPPKMTGFQWNWC